MITIASHAVQLTWDDGSSSAFHHTWLRDHCPQSVHPVSGQRELPLHSIPSLAQPSRICLQESAQAQQLVVSWPAALDPTGLSHESTFDVAWLRANRYSSSTPPCPLEADEPPPKQWGRGGQGLPPPIEWASLEGCGSSSQHALLALLCSLQQWGVARVSAVPPSMEATSRLARMLGAVHETFYGTMWDTAPRAEGDVIDTAYTSCELPLHTDGTYLMQQPGLQLFNCVAQPDRVHGLDGSTRLADSLALASKLEQESPETLKFFCRVVLPFEHREGEVHMRCVSPVFTLHPVSRQIVGIRWNETDRGPMNTLEFEDVGQFYTHAKILQAALDDLELSLRLTPGDALVVDNHRVMHGRRGFVGHRRLLGCYLHTIGEASGAYFERN
ncbi:MAG: hypothetical protein SGPRY_006045 [Prymnesium sp.]